MPVFQYEVSFAGIPFLIDQAVAVRMQHPVSEQEMGEENTRVPRVHQPLPDLIEELDRIYPYKYLKDFSLPSAYPGRNLGAIAYRTELEKPSPDIKINDFYYPNTACRWGVFRGLATSTQAKQMLAATQGQTPATFKIKGNPQGAGRGNESSYTVETEMYLLPPRPIAEHGGQRDGLYLMTLVDERYYFQGTPVSLRPNYGATWQDLIDELADALEIEVTPPLIEDVYSKPEADSQLWVNWENAAVLLDAVAYNIGTVVVRAYDGTYTLQTPSYSRSVANSNRGTGPIVIRTAGGDIFQSGQSKLKVGDLGAARNAVVPAVINVSFPLYVSEDFPVPHLMNSRYAPQRPSCWFEEGFGNTYTVSVPILSGGTQVQGLTGLSEEIMRCTAKAWISGETFVSGDPINASGLTSLAMRLAQDHYGWRVLGNLDETYPGIFAWAPEGLHDIIWTYSARSRQATTRIIRSSWTQEVVDFQHGGPYLSGYTGTPRGVGGPSVAQTVQDSYGGASVAGWLIGLASGTVYATLRESFLSGSMVAKVHSVDYLPTQNRWRGKVDDEIILFEGTLGLNDIDVVYRGIDGTLETNHNNNVKVFQQVPNTNYGTNLVTHEKGQFVFPEDWTSGGVQGVNVVPQTQTVMVLDGTGILIKGYKHHSGRMMTYDPTQPPLGGYSIAWQEQELVWVVDRNAGLHSTFSSTSGQVLSGGTPTRLQSGIRYDGQLLGFSAVVSGYAKAAPVYGADHVGADETILIQLTHKFYSGGPPEPFIAYSWAQVIDVDLGELTRVRYYSGTLSGGPGAYPAYHQQDVDYPTFPITPNIDAFGNILSGGGIAPLSIVRARRAIGPYYLFDQNPLVELVRRTPDSDTYGVKGYTRIWNQSSGSLLPPLNSGWMDYLPCRIQPAG